MLQHMGRKMDITKRKELLLKIQGWFVEKIVASHVQNTEKLKNLKEFDINPFLVAYLAKFLHGEATPENIAKALVYPRALGTSITTSFGMQIQKFTNDVLKSSFGSMIPGMDIEFTDALDGEKKYCQMKLGPKTINHDDIETIHGKFNSGKKIAKQNGLRVHDGDFVIAVIFGEKSQVNSFYKTLETEHHYSLFVGAEFWHRLTGDENFYSLMVEACSESAKNYKGTELLQNVIEEISKDPEIVRLSELAE